MGRASSRRCARRLLFLRRAAGQLGDQPDRFVQVETLERAIEALRSPPGRPCPFQLVITHWGANEEPPTALALLEEMRKQDLRCPVVVFSSSAEADARKQTALGLGAQAYCFRWESLFREVQRIFEPGDRTG